jgi:hypothetical protein
MKLSPNDKQRLIDKVIEQIKLDIAGQDVTAIDELLHFVPDNYLIGYLPDEDPDGGYTRNDGSTQEEDDASMTEPTDEEIEKFKEDWGQSHSEICANLDIPEDGLDEYLMDDYFWIPNDMIWCNKHASFFTPREQVIADFLIEVLSRLD